MYFLIVKAVITYLIEFNIFLLKAPQRWARHMSKISRRTRGMHRSDGATLANDSCKRGDRIPECVKILMGRYPEPQDAMMSPEAQAGTSASNHAEETARHADKAEKYAQVTADILGRSTVFSRQSDYSYNVLSVF